MSVEYITIYVLGTLYIVFEGLYVWTQIKLWDTKKNYLELLRSLKIKKGNHQ